MRSPTPHYNELVAAQSRLDILVRGIDPLECKSKLQHLKLQSYILLTHAVIETYLESLVMDVATSARDKIKNNGEICKALMGLIASGLVGEIETNKSNRKIQEKLFRDIADFSVSAYNAFVSVVSNNNGVTEKDQKKLFLPIGVNPAAIDVVTMNALSAFGVKRGGIAHKLKIEREDTLSGVKSDLKTIIDGLLNFDEAACEALAKEMSVSKP